MKGDKYFNQEDALKQVGKELDRAIWIRSILLVIMTYVALTCTIMRIKHPEYTETQLLMATPRALVWNFK